MYTRVDLQNVGQVWLLLPRMSVVRRQKLDPHLFKAVLDYRIKIYAVFFP